MLDLTLNVNFSRIEQLCKVSCWKLPISVVCSADLAAFITTDLQHNPAYTIKISAADQLINVLIYTQQHTSTQIPSIKLILKIL